jgi:curved DNA-binding protein CbpA
MDWDPKSAPKLDFDEDYYSVLEVDPTIKAKDLKKAYYKLVFKFHPDNKEGGEAKALCNKQMMVINNAYQTLKTEDKRSVYDRKRKFGNSGGFRSGSGGGAPAGSSPRSSSGRGGGGGHGVGSADGDFGFDFGKYGSYNPKKQQQEREEEEGPDESLGDIFSDMYRDILGANKGGGIMDDLLDFLEGDGGGRGKFSPFADDDGSNRGGYADEKSRGEIDGELEVLDMAIQNLDGRYATVKKSRVEQERLLLTTKPKAGEPRDIGKLEERLQRIEEVRGLAARQTEMEKQLRQLKRKRNRLQELRNYL